MCSLVKFLHLLCVRLPIAGKHHFFCWHRRVQGAAEAFEVRIMDFIREDVASLEGLGQWLALRAVIYVLPTCIDIFGDTEELTGLEVLRHIFILVRLLAVPFASVWDLRVLEAPVSTHLTRFALLAMPALRRSHGVWRLRCGNDQAWLESAPCLNATPKENLPWFPRRRDPRCRVRPAVVGRCAEVSRDQLLPYAPECVVCIPGGEPSWSCSVARCEAHPRLRALLTVAQAVGQRGPRTQGSIAHDALLDP
mmetsp:Transcript_6900/g.16388  ORF Transcript_6900/g.16388 Transcript_6900/m.16388 type:complete len:251 (-) Transcript_6900:19-771(-)